MKKFYSFLFTMLVAVALTSCIMEEVRVPENGKEPDDDNGGGISITIPGGFSVMGTRGLSEYEESVIDDLWMLLFSADNTLVSAEQIPAASITPGDEANEHRVRIKLPPGNHKIVVLANSADLGNNNGRPVQVGDLLWAPKNVANRGTFAASPYLYDYVADVRNYQYTWTQVTGGTSGNTAAGYCPEDWRLPTRTEYFALAVASSSVWTTKIGPEGEVGGREFTITTSGQKLFFPASGTNNGIYLGVNGNYWSDEQYSSDTTNGFNLSFKTNGTPNAADRTFKSSRLSVRCVRDVEPETRASTRAVIGDLIGQSYNDVRAAMVGNLTIKMYEVGGAIPMWGESGMVNTGAAGNVHIDLHRAIAKTDVEVGAAVPFEMTSVVVARPNNKYSVIPSAANLDADGVPASPSIPEETTAFTTEESASLFIYSGSAIAREIYVPEAELADVAYTDRMALVIGGKYKGDDPANETVTWYRVEFRNDTGLVDIVRNHLYAFTVSAVRGPGSADVETAYESEILNMTTTVVDWHEVNFDPELGR